MIKRKAFTIAEVLVTLLLIGVVAALTLPFFIDSFQKTKWTLSYKRSFAETFNALTRLALEEDCAKSLTCTHVFDGGQNYSTEIFGSALTKVMSTSQNCGIVKPGVEGDVCFSHKVKVGLSDAEQESLFETIASDVDFIDGFKGFYTFKTNRGVSYAVFSFGMSCLNVINNENDKKYRDSYINAYVIDPEKEDNQMMSLCGFVIIDVNAEQSPNTWGRDVFGFWITDQSALGVYPFGGDYDKKFHGACNTGSAQDTRGCASQLIKDGWKMTY